MKQRIVPFAVTVVLMSFSVIVCGVESAEAAERARREPFYQLYEKSTAETIAFEGTVNVVSSVPVPAKNDYDDCLYSVFVELESFKSDHRLKKAPPKEIIVNIPIMKSKKIISDNLLYPGDKISVTAAEYDAMPKEIQQIQLSDDIQSYEHQYYFAKTLKKITSFSAGGNSNFGTREITILPIQTLPKDEAAAKKRQERIQQEIARIEAELKKHGGSFAEWKKEYQSIGDKYKQLCKDGVKGWIGNSYFAAMGKELTWYNTKMFISGILPFKKYLEGRNIDLIVVRVPFKADFAARVYASDDFQENPAWIEHYYECLKNDIEIVDPMYEMWKERFDHPLFYFFQHKQEEPPYEGAYLAIARNLSEVLSRYSYVKDDNITWGKAAFAKNVVRDERRYYPPGNSMFSENGKPRELTFKCILLNNEHVGRLKTYGGSPFVCLSNSFFGITYLQDKGASLPHYLCCCLRHMVDWKYQNGMGNNMLRILLSDRNALNRRKAVIMLGLWGGGFSVIPRYLVDNAQKLVLVETIGVDSILKQQNNGTFDSQIQKSVSMFRGKKGKIRFDIEIPSMPNYKTCMIRMNVPTALTKISVSVTDSNGKVLDSIQLTTGNGIRSDLFVPASEKKQKLTVVIDPRVGFTFGIKNIELWGF